MPKSDQLVLRIDVAGAPVGNAYQIEWPATVERVEGQWLRITDNGGYGLPPLSGWVSKEDVLKLDESYDHYMSTLRKAEAPWVHWLIGIYLQSKKEAQSARKEYLECLNLAPDAPDAAVPAAVERCPGMLDAAVRLTRMNAAAAKSVGEAMAAAEVLRGLSDAAARASVRRPRLIFEHAEALRRAYHLNWSSKGEGTTDGQALFQRARDAYQPLVAPRSGSVHEDPQTWRGHLGKAELYMDQAAMLLDQTTSLISKPREEAGPPASKQAADAAASAVTASDANGLDTVQTQIDIGLLSRFVDTLKAAQPAPGAIQRAKAASGALAASIQSLNAAIDCFDEAIRKGPGVIEAYRDRSLAYLMLARSEATLAAIVDANPKIEEGLAGILRELALPPRKLDRAMVATRMQFNEAVATLRKAQEDLARVSEEQKDLADAESEIAKKYLSPAATGGSAGGDGGKKVAAAPGPTPDLATLRAKLKQLRSEADAFAAEPEARKQASEIRARIQDAKAALAKSYDALNQSQNLLRARSSAHAACDRGNYVNGESLKLLAAVYASQCNFDRAEYYQKLAVIFASEDDRPGILATLDEYRKMGELVLAKAHAKTPGAAAGQAGASKPSSDGGAD